MLKTQQILALKNHRNLENMTKYTVIAILDEAVIQKNVVKKVSLSERKLLKYFPEDYSASKCERIIVSLLENWKKEQSIQNENEENVYQMSI